MDSRLLRSNKSRQSRSRAGAVLRNENDMVLLHEWLINYKMRGERGGQRKRVYHARSYLNRQTGRIEERREWVRLPSEIRRLKQELAVQHDGEIHPIKNSPMREVLLAVGMAIFNGGKDCPEDIKPKHWRHNIRAAKKRLRHIRLTKDKWVLGEICNAIIRPIRVKGRVRQILCKTCHTPLLIGYYVEGHKVTRKKEFCGDACRMMAERRGPL